MKQVCESALFHQKNESYPQCGAENAQKDAVASKVYLTFDATAPFIKYFIKILRYLDKKRKDDILFRYQNKRRESM